MIRKQQPLGLLQRLFGVRRGGSELVLAPGSFGGNPASVPKAAEAVSTRRLLTGADCAVPITEHQRKYAAVFSDGSFFVHQRYIDSTAVLSIGPMLARHHKFQLKAPTPCDHSELRRLYGDAKLSTDPLRGRIMEVFRGIIETAARCRASDVSFVLFEGRCVVRFQLDGFLSDAVTDLDEEETERLFTAAFYFGDVGDNIEHPGRSQKVAVTRINKLDGTGLIGLRMQFSYPPAGGRLLVIRLIPKNLPIQGRGFTPLALPDAQVEQLTYLLSLSKGLMTVMGPTESGKSTFFTIFFLAYSDLNDGRVRIVAMADTPEGLDPRITHLPVEPHPDRPDEDPYTVAMEDFLRISPHVGRVDECRTAVAANALFTLGRTGKLMGTTVHGDDFVDLPQRYIDLQVDPAKVFAISSHVAWFGSRLVPLLCPGCRIRAADLLQIDWAEQAIQSLGLRPDGPKAKRLERHGEEMRPIASRFKRLLAEEEFNQTFVAGCGCPDCEPQANVAGREFGIRGIRGRQFLLEIWEPTEVGLNMIRDGAFEAARREIIRTAGPYTLRMQGYNLLVAGKIGLKEYTNFIGSAEALALELRLQRETLSQAAE